MKELNFTMQQLIKMTNLSRATIDRWRKEGLPSYKLGRSVRFNREETMKWLEKNKIRTL